MLATRADLPRTRTTTMRQAESTSRRGWKGTGLTGALLGVLLLAPAGARAALITITDCAADPHIAIVAGNVVIDVGSDDLELKCDPVPPGPSSGIVVRGHDIKLRASLIFPGRPFGEAISVIATGEIDALGISLEATNPNASMRIESVGNQTYRNVTARTGTPPRSGRDMRILCTGPRCEITARQSSFHTNRFAMLANGDIYFGLVKITTGQPRDRIDILSQAGNAWMSGCGNVFQMSEEGRFNLQVCKQIDLAFATVNVGRDIDIFTTATCGSDLQTDIRLTGTTLRNDFGKKGDITVATADGQEINICGAVIIDDDANDVSELNGRELVPHDGFNNVVGPADIDD